MKEKRIPIRDKSETDCEFIERNAIEQIAYQKNLLRAIDAIPANSEQTTDARTNKKYNFQSAASAHDFLADRPKLLARYKEIGPLALLEF